MTLKMIAIIASAIITRIQIEGAVVPRINGNLDYEMRNSVLSEASSNTAET